MQISIKSDICKTAVVAIGTLITSTHVAIITFKNYSKIKEALALRKRERFLKILKIYAPSILTFGVVTVLDFLAIKRKPTTVRDDEEDDGLLFYDSFSNEYFTCAEENMNDALKKIRVDYFEKGFYSLYDFYKYVGYTPSKVVLNKIWCNPNFKKNGGYLPPTYFPCQVDDMTCYLITFPDNFKEDIKNGNQF